MKDILNNKPDSAMDTQNKAQELMQQAENAEEYFDFLTAYRLFIRVARIFNKFQDTDKANTCLVRAATCLEKSQTWRGSSALWENIGDNLGKTIDLGYNPSPPSKPGQSGMFHIISWQDWIDPEDGYYGDSIRAKRCHQQAWAFMWAAEEAEAAHQYNQATKLFQKAAISWEISKWGECEPDPSNDKLTRERLKEIRGEKWKLAAKYYFKAIYNIIQDRGRNPDEVYMFTPYEPHEVGWVSEDSQHRDDVHKKSGNIDRIIDRMIYCLRNYGHAQKDLAGALKEACRMISLLQEQLTSVGKRKEAAILYRKRKKLMLEIYKIHINDLFSWEEMNKKPNKVYHKVFRGLIYYYHWLGFKLTGSNSDPKRVFLCIVIPMYIFVFPAIFFLSGWLKHENGTILFITPIDAVLFSLANTVSISIGDYTTKNSLAGTITQTANSLSAYFVLGYLIWIMTRSLEE